MLGDGEVGYMKIYEHSLTGAATGQTSRSQDTQKTGSGREARTATQGFGDRVEFSEDVGALSRAVSADQASRASRVQALTNQVQSGTYHPDSRAIGRGMISEATAAR
jgi:flagellar biosynthesis anti-sigma factor FlgM